jgi:hypothetical protein
VGKELANLVEIIGMHSGEPNALRPNVEETMVNLSPLDECNDGESFTT